jgi:hypothetical protein
MISKDHPIPSKACLGQERVTVGSLEIVNGGGYEPC